MNEQDKEKFTKKIQRAFDTHDAAALVHIPPLINMFMDNPNQAIDLISETYNKALDDAYTSEDGVNQRAFVQAIAGGPYEAIPWALYNAVGRAYPYLEREQKDRALSEILGILDTRNYIEVNGGRGAGHTTGIREPLLLSDITLARPLYWPGLHDEEHLWRDKDSFYDLQSEIIDEEGMFNPRKVNSDFLVAYAILRNDFTPFGEEYVRVANSNFLNRVLKGIVARRFAFIREEEKVGPGIKRLQELLPESVHEKLEILRQEKDWTDYTKFR